MGQYLQEKKPNFVFEIDFYLTGRKHSWLYAYLFVYILGGSHPDQLHQVKSESKEMIDSFSQVTLELQQIVNFLNKPLEEQQMVKNIKYKKSQLTSLFYCDFIQL